jgi:hypothetical protein
LDTPPSWSSSSEPRQRPNQNTWFSVSASAAYADGTALRDAYARAIRRAASLPCSVTGHRLFWVRGDREGAAVLRATDGAYKIVGRHTHADVVLHEDSRVALRHLVLRSMVTAEGELALRVLDLHTALGFSVDDGIARRSIVARGPLVFAVGTYTIVALPTDDVPVALPPPFFEEVNSPYRSPGRRPFGASHIGILPGIAELGDLKNAGGAMHAFSLERWDRGKETVLVSEAELEQGVAVGRSPRAHRQLLQLMDESVSRMHLLLVREQGTTYAIDLCSMNGTWCGSERVRRVPLGPGAVLRFGNHCKVTLRWLGNA